ncbi:MAG: transcriptional regulator [Oscillibacter sp.]|nr:transcriptional regulator [Oscillibacter sp.]
MQERLVRAAIGYKLMSLRQLAAKMGTSVQNLSHKLKRGSLKRADMEQIAEILGAEYEIEEHFVFPDGTRI